MRRQPYQSLFYSRMFALVFVPMGRQKFDAILFAWGFINLPPTDVRHVYPISLSFGDRGSRMQTTIFDSVQGIDTSDALSGNTTWDLSNTGKSFLSSTKPRLFAKERMRAGITSVPLNEQVSRVSRLESLDWLQTCSLIRFQFVPPYSIHLFCLILK